MSNQLLELRIHSIDADKLYHLKRTSEMNLIKTNNFKRRRAETVTLKSKFLSVIFKNIQIAGK